MLLGKCLGFYDKIKLELSKNFLVELNISKCKIEDNIKMNLSAINLNQNNRKVSFNGLYGHKLGGVCNIPGLGKRWVLAEIDRYFPFRDEVVKNFPKIIRRATSKGYPARHVSLQEGVLPFTREEFMAYKAKNGTRIDKLKLTEQEKQIEDFFENNGYNLGIYTDRNRYLIKPKNILQRLYSKIFGKGMDEQDSTTFLTPLRR